MKNTNDVIKKLFKVTETALNSNAAKCPIGNDGRIDCKTCPFSRYINGSTCGIAEIRNILKNCRGSIPGFCDKEGSKDVQC